MNGTCRQYPCIMTFFGAAGLTAGRFLSYIFLCILYDIGHGDRSHFPFHGVLDPIQLVVEDIVNVPAHRTLLIGVFVEVEKLSLFNAVHGPVNIQQGYVLQRPGKRRSAKKRRTKVMSA